MNRSNAWMRPIKRHPQYLLACLGLSLTFITGCASGANSVLSRWSMVRDEGIARGISGEEYANAAKSSGRQRFGPAGVIDYFRGKDGSQQQTNAANVAADALKKTSSRDNWQIQQVAADPETEAEFQVAEKAFQQGNLSDAKSRFKKLAKRHKGKPMGESAQFYVAECEFQQSDFVSAHDSYERLVADYPGTRFLDRVVAREYAIARQWLVAAGMDLPKLREDSSASLTPGGFRDRGPELIMPKLPDDKKPAADKDKDPAVTRAGDGPAAETDKSASDKAAIASDLPVAPEKVPWYARFTGLLPGLDVRGHGFAALEHVRHHDPTGPLADDATILLADAYFQFKDYDTANIYYDQFLTDFPKSPMYREAQEKSILSKVNSYIGPEYDAQQLEKARELIQRTLAAYPDRPRDEQKRLYHLLDLITDQEAERAYLTGDYYRRTGKAMAAEFYLGKVIAKYPNSTWAEKSREQMELVAKMPRKFTAPSKIMSQPGAPDPMSMSRGSNSGPGSMMNPNNMTGP